MVDQLLSSIKFYPKKSLEGKLQHGRTYRSPQLLENTLLLSALLHMSLRLKISHLNRRPIERHHAGMQVHYNSQNASNIDWNTLLFRLTLYAKFKIEQWTYTSSGSVDGDWKVHSPSPTLGDKRLTEMCCDNREHRTKSNGSHQALQHFQLRERKRRQWEQFIIYLREWTIKADR